MKFLHTGDLHLGKTVNDFSMMEDQRFILRQIVEKAREEKADAVVISGDIYDRAIPPAEAVTLLDDFLTRLVELAIPVLLISGNHDSPERIGFAEDILQQKGVWIAGIYRDRLKKVTFSDSYGEVTFVLMPFVKPSAVDAKTSGEAVEKLLREEKLAREEALQPENRKTGGRFVLVTHFFVTDQGREPEISDGETSVHVGGLDNVEASLFRDFDYVALGHIHKPQKIGSGPVYYAGAPLAYSFSEAGHTKYMNLVELGRKGDCLVSQIPFKPLHEMRKIKGNLKDLMREDVADAADRNDYIQAVLTNKEELIDPVGTLRLVYPNLMQLILEKNEQTGKEAYESRLTERKKSIAELFNGFYELVREAGPDEERERVIAQAAEEAQEGQI